MNLNLSETLLRNCPYSDIGELRAINCNDHIISHFNADQWNEIIGWTNDERRLCKVIQKYKPIMAAFLYIDKKSNSPLAFTFVIVENIYRKIASFHGGGWGNAWSNYRCAKMIIESIEKSGYSVRTSIAVTNKRARRFMIGLGFEVYRYSNARALYRRNFLGK